MKQKYLASACIIGTFASCALAYDLAAEPAPAPWQQSQDSRLQMLDARLADKVNELLLLGELLSEHMSYAQERQQLAHYNQNQPLLVGSDVSPKTSRPEKPEVLQQPQVKRKVTPSDTLVQTEPSAFKVKHNHSQGVSPVWEEYRLSMIVVSDTVHLAVINNQYIRSGDQLLPGITVTDITADKVVLKRNKQTIQLAMASE